MEKKLAWPIYFKDRLIMGDFDSNVGVATLWMPKENVADELGNGLFSVCGQLYTKRGINPLIRNILANPKIRHLVICGPDRQGSGDALIRFFRDGVSGGTIAGDSEALIDKEISNEALNLLRRSIFVHDMRNQPLDKIKAFVQKLPSLPPFGSPQVFPQENIELKSGFPSDLSVFKIRRDHIADAWLDVLKTVIRFGVDTPGMYGKVKQVYNLTVVIDKEDTAKPNLPSYISFKKESLANYYTGFFDLNSKHEEAYTYGERIFNFGDKLDQEELMVKKLKQFPYDRGAVAVLWDPQKDNFPPAGQSQTKDGQTKGWKVPCLVMLLAQCAGEKLNLTAIFRNNDMYGAWPLNAFALRKFQEEIARKIKKQVGSLTTTSHIAEIYEADWELSAKTVQENDSLGRTCVYDSRGYYTVKVQDSNIVVDFFSPDGATLLTTLSLDGSKPKAARDLCAMAIKDMLISELGAACDLGRQLAKAETAVKLGLKFEQDQPLAFK